MDDKVTPINAASTRQWLKFETEQGFADRFVSLYGDDVRFVRASRTFYSWDGRFWEPDEHGITDRLIHKCARDLTIEAKKVPDEEKRTKRVAVAKQYESYKKQQAVLAIARDMIPVATKADAFDRDPLLFSARNGTIDLRTGELSAHRREDMISKISPVEYDPDATCPRWMSFLAEIFPSDSDLAAYVQRAVGYSLTGETREHKMFILYGNGSNGKGTFTGIIENIAGDYGTVTPAETFIGRKDNAPTNDLARLHNVRFVSSSEAEDNKSLSEAFVKSITGGDPILARMMYREFFEFKPMFKLWLSTNYKPNVRGADDGIWRRLALIPFNAKFPEETRDTALPVKLNAELPGILAWAVRGAVAYLKDGLATCSAVAGATAAYRRDMDTFGTFLEQRCETDPQGSASTAELVAAYNAWAAKNGERNLSARGISLKLQSRVGFTPYRSGKQRGFDGIRLLLGEPNDDACDAYSGVLPNPPYARAQEDFGKKSNYPSQASHPARVSPEHDDSEAWLEYAEQTLPEDPF